MVYFDFVWDAVRVLFSPFGAFWSPQLTLKWGPKTDKASFTSSEAECRSASGALQKKKEKAS